MKADGTSMMQANGRRLLAALVAFPVLFYGAAAVQALFRSGFDITQHPLSLLALGEYGWVQTANFLATGALAILGSVGLRRRLRGTPGGRWAPILVGVFGVGIIIAGIFPADPSLGFPPGAPKGVPETISASAQIHGLGFFLAFGALTASCFVFARRWRSEGNRRWAILGVAAGVLTPILIILGMVVPSATSELFAIAGIPPFATIAGAAVRLRRSPPRSDEVLQQDVPADAPSARD